MTGLAGQGPASSRRDAPGASDSFDASGSAGFERRIGQVLIALTYAAVAALVVGAILMAVRGISPLDAGPPLALDRLVGDLIDLDPAAFLWLGLIVVLAAPITRVAVAGVAYARGRQWLMVLVSVAILAIIAIAIVSAVVSEG